MAVSLDITALRARRPEGLDLAATQGDGLGCHAGKVTRGDRDRGSAPSRRGPR